MGPPKALMKKKVKRWTVSWLAAWHTSVFCADVTWTYSYWQMQSWLQSGAVNGPMLSSWRQQSKQPTDLSTCARDFIQYDRLGFERKTFSKLTVAGSNKECLLVKTIHLLVYSYHRAYGIRSILLPERDYITFGSLLWQILLSSVTFVRPTQGVETSDNICSQFCTLAIVWPPCKILQRRPKLTLLSGTLNARGVAKQSDGGPVSHKRYKILPRVQLMTNSKSYPQNPLVALSCHLISWWVSCLNGWSSIDRPKGTSPKRLGQGPLVCHWSCYCGSYIDVFLYVFFGYHDSCIELFVTFVWYYLNCARVDLAEIIRCLAYIGFPLTWKVRKLIWLGKVRILLMVRVKLCVLSELCDCENTHLIRVSNTPGNLLE